MPSTGPPRSAKPRYCIHDRGKARHRTGAQVIAVREPAGQNHDVGALQIGVLVPEILGLLAEQIGRGVICVFVAIAAGKDDDTETHGQSPTSMR
jgi:hypothetical protein